MPYGETKLSQHRLQKLAEVKAGFEAEKYTMKVDEYVNNSTNIEVTCPRGHAWSTTWNAFQQGKRCRQCWIEDSRLTTEQIADELAKRGCELLSEYKGTDARFKYLCKCGKVSWTRWHDFQRGHDCKRCGGEKRRDTQRRQRLELLQQFLQNGGVNTIG